MFCSFKFAIFTTTNKRLVIFCVQCDVDEADLNFSRSNRSTHKIGYLQEQYLALRPIISTLTALDLTVTMDCDDGCGTPPPPPPASGCYNFKKAYHPFIVMRKYEATSDRFSDEDGIDMCLEYLADIPFASNCKVLKKRRGQTHQACNCLQILQDEVAQEAVA